jgi:hypothetical protein
MVQKGPHRCFPTLTKQQAAGWDDGAEEARAAQQREQVPSRRRLLQREKQSSRDCSAENCSDEGWLCFCCFGCVGPAFTWLSCQHHIIFLLPALALHDGKLRQGYAQAFRRWSHGVQQQRRGLCVHCQHHVCSLCRHGLCSMAGKRCSMLHLSLIRNLPSRHSQGAIAAIALSLLATAPWILLPP